MAKENILKLKQIINYEKILVMLDRNYSFLELFDFSENNSIKFVVRIKKTDCKKEQRSLSNDDDLINIELTKSKSKSIN